LVLKKHRPSYFGLRISDFLAFFFNPPGDPQDESVLSGSGIFKPPALPEVMTFPPQPG
jgi:hypothetical protein